MLSPDATRARSELPAVDEPLVAPETRYEVLDGGLVHVSPAHEPHGSRHSKVSALVEAHVAPEFDVASDMLTRTSETDDVAPDVSVFPYARDPETGGRQVEHLAFEIVSTESMSHAGQKAAKLVRRGVRRVFAIDVERERALEWSRSRGTWSLLDPSGHIEDLALAVPLPIEALVHAAKADDAMARALLAKRNPVLEATRARDRLTARAEGKLEGLAEGKLEGLAEGKLEGLAEGKLEGAVRGKIEALLVVLTMRGVSPDPTARARIIGERDPDRLDRWIARATTCTSLPEVFAEP
jgi:Uma2 family endonuclease